MLEACHGSFIGTGQSEWGVELQFMVGAEAFSV